MAKIAIVTDSVACIPEDLVKKFNIYVAPVHIIWDKVDYRDSIDLKTSDFYKRLRTSKTLPTTTSAIQGEYIKIFESLQGKVDGIVTLALTGALGASYNSALNAKELVTGTPIEVIDTRTAMMAQGFAVLAAAKVAAAGGSMAEVAQAGRETAARTHVFWAMDTLDYLRKGGRVSLPQAVLAGWLKVKPFVGIIESKAVPVARVRNKSNVTAKLFELMEEALKGKGGLHLAVMHGDATAEAEILEKLAVEKYHPVELLRSEITPVIGTHTGPGTLGFAFYQE